MVKHMSKTLKRLLCLILCLATILPCVSLPVFGAAGGSDGNTGTAPHESKETESIDGVTYSINRYTKYLGNRTYEVKISLASSMSVNDYAVNRDSAQNGYFYVEKSGWYLLELWGGAGADGQDNIALSLGLIPGLYPGGDGAVGGYVYAKAWLEAGQILIWSIGTHGAQSVTFDDDTGGENGDGGTHGGSGSHTVGGGGGYSVFYLLNKEDLFDPSWVTETSVYLPETTRLSRYLLIAGGGGGGGAGCSSILINGSVVNAPHGGRGGRINDNYYISLLDDAYTVKGYVFSGADGYSSGTSTKYVGKGGTNVPGEDPSTWLGVTNSASAPNDWSGIANPVLDPGAGGSGNYRGGGGGAGYAGGSGGIMTSAFSAANVGGGGGGSSFIASMANGNPLYFKTADIPEEERAYLRGFSQNPAGSEAGGAAHITYLGDENQSVDPGTLSNITLTAQISKYFDIVNKHSDSGNENLSISAADANGYVTVTAKKLSIAPRTAVSNGQTAVLTLRLRAKDDFLGGNNVEMVRATDDGVKMDFTNPSTGQPYTFRSIAENNKTHNYVNVPLSTKMVTYSYTNSNPEQISYAVDSLYEDSYASVRELINTTSAGWQYDFIKSIGNYKVTDPNGNDITAQERVQPQVTTKYTVSYPITVKTAAWDTTTVGPAIAVDGVVTGTSVISIVMPDTGVLNSLKLAATKALSFDDGAYKLAVAVQQTSNSVLMPLTAETILYTNGSIQTWIAPANGWYYVQAWGGNGGNSGDCEIAQKVAGTTIGTGASGGRGGYNGGLIYLERDQAIEYLVGAVGSDGGDKYYKLKDSNDYELFGGNPGGGGSHTYVKFGTQYLIIAGGGAGAGGSAAATSGNLLRSKSANGTAGSSSTALITTVDDMSSFNGTSGSPGSAGRTENWLAGYNYTASAGGAGNAGKNYYNSGLLSGGYDTTGGVAPALSDTAALYMNEIVNKSSASTKTNRNGQVTITLLETEESATELAKLYDLSVEGSISRYFDIDSIEMEQLSVSASSSNVTDNGDGSKTIVYYDSSSKEISRFTYRIVTNADGSSEWIVSNTSYIPVAKEDAATSTMTYQSDLTFTLTLYPKDGFLGGNDVPLVQYDHDREEDASNYPYNGVRVNQNDGFMNLQPKNPTDFANVAIEYDLLEIFETQDKTVHLGDVVPLSDLYTFNIPAYTGADAWKADFVEFVNPTGADLTPTKTETVELTASLAPKTAATRAVIIEEIVAQTYTLPATVYVEIPVTFELTNMTPTGDVWVLYGDSLLTTIVPEVGYMLPNGILIAYNDTSLGSPLYEYEPSGGQLMIPTVVAPMTVQGTADIKTYQVHFSYTLDDATYQEKTFEYVAGAVIDYSWAENFASERNTTYAKEGHQFYWDYWSYDTDGNAYYTHEAMPGHDLWFTGSYVKLLYPLHITYQYEDGTQAAEPYDGLIYYGNTYSIVSPMIENYKADLPIVSGTQGTDPVSVTVTYKQSANELTVLYVKPDGTQIADPHNMTYDIGAEYSVTSPTVNGYTPYIVAGDGTRSDGSTVTGTMTATGSTVTVTYFPDQYTVDFVYRYLPGEYTPDISDALDEVDFSAATINGDDPRTVEYDSLYGYNALTQSYDGLPKAQMAGYTFDGWYLDAALTVPFDEEDEVAVGDITVYAKWKPAIYKLQVRFEFLYEDGDFLPEPYQSDVEALRTYLQTYNYSNDGVGFGTTVQIDLAEFVGYTAYTAFGTSNQTAVTGDILSVKMPGQNYLLIVTYEINTYRIDFKDQSGQNVTYSDAATSTVAVDSFDTEWKTVYVKHDIQPKYVYKEDVDDGDDTTPDPLPKHSTRPEYTYTFTGWVGPDLNADSLPEYYAYSEEHYTVVFPNATGDTVYYACYTATENIVYVEFGSNAYYYTNVTDALAFVKAQFPSWTTITMTFRRNAGNSDVIDLDTYGRLELASGFANGTKTLNVNLNGKTLRTSGAPVLSNDGNTSLTLAFVTSGGSLVADGSGDVNAVVMNGGTMNINVATSITAHSSDGTATAIAISSSATVSDSSSSACVSVIAEGTNAYGFTSSDATGSVYLYGTVDSTADDTAYGIYNVNYIYPYSSAEINVNAVGSEISEACGIYGSVSGTVGNNAKINVGSTGTGTGIIATKSRSLSNPIITVTAKNAVGVAVMNGATLTLSNTGCRLSVNGTASAVGIDVQTGATLSNSAKLSNPITVSSNGTAYGIVNAGTVSLINMELDVDATGSGDAYGFYNNGGTMTASAVTSLIVDATSVSGKGYGLYSVGGAVGAGGDNESTYLSKGQFAGSSYGIYCEDGSIFVRGYDLFFKGATVEGDEEATINQSISGAVIYPGYDITEAITPEGYYRLAKMITLSFETNGGTEIESITGYNDMPVVAPAAPTRAGCEFDGWRSDEALQNVTAIPTVIPRVDTTLYAAWEYLVYEYAYADSFKNLEVIFHKNYKTTPPTTIDADPTAPFGTVHLTQSNMTISREECPYAYADHTYLSGTTLYIFTGWYTSASPTSDTYVRMSGNLAPYDTDQDGTLELYAGWVSVSSCKEYAKMGDTKPTSTSEGCLLQSHTSSSNYMMYYVIPEEGAYNAYSINIALVSYSTSTSYRKYTSILRYTPAGASTNIKSNSYSLSNRTVTNTRDQIDTVMPSSYLANTASSSIGTYRPGDVILVKMYSYNTSSSYRGRQYAYITSTMELPDESTYMAYTTYDINEYTVEGGNYTLPISTENTDPNYRFAGWSNEADPNLLGTLIMELSPELTETLEEWRNGELLVLHPKWQELIWDSYVSGKRDFSAFETTDEISIKDNGYLSVRFVQRSNTTDSMILKFASGLPAGTLLTLIDRSAALPAYYSYTVTDELLTELPTTAFVQMEDGVTAFEGCASDIVVQICYTNADMATVDEIVGLYADYDVLPQTDRAYGVIDTAPVVTEKEDTEFSYDTVYETSVTVPDLSMLGFSENDRVYMMIYWEKISMAAGAQLAVDGNPATLYGGDYAAIELGVVSSLTAGSELIITMDLGTMVQNEFADVLFYYDICVVPAAWNNPKMLFGAERQTVTSDRQRITLLGTPSIRIDDFAQHSLSAGETLRIENIVFEGEATDLRLFLYQMVEVPGTTEGNGTQELQYTEACGTLFAPDSGFAVSPNGIMTESGAPVVVDGVFEAVISENAAVGTYYLRFIFGDKVITLLIRIN